MKVSLNWAQYYSNVPLLKDKQRLITQIGAQLGEIDGVADWGPQFDGIVVVKVVDCIKHPNADKLSLCQIDDGGVVKPVTRNSDGLVQVVCGAPNVKAGLLAAWIPPGMTVPATREADPFVLEAREIRGQVSNGMLASLQELGISDNHDGILEITADDVGRDKARPGTPFKELYGLDDLVVDIENKMFTHRPDCFGVLGVARELAGIQRLAFKSPDWYTRPPQFETARQLPLEVKVEDKKLVPRFMAVALANVSIGPSPVWMQAGLTRVGIRPINNVVDITNFYMYLTGQPMHAYDYDKVKKLSKSKPVLIARQAKPKEAVNLLNGKAVSVEAPTIVIATDQKAIGLGGVMGGAETEVDKHTTNIILECANFDMYNIRRTSMKYGLFTDAVTRFNKGQSVHQVDRVLAKAIEDLQNLAKASQASDVADVSAEKAYAHGSVAVTADFINARLGTKLSLKDIADLLENVEFKVVTAPADKKTLHVSAPFWRTDIAIPEDLVEEVGRLYGYDRLPQELPKRDLTPAEPDSLMAFRANIRNILAAAGANELLTYSFVHGDLLKKVGQDTTNAYELSNAISPDLQFLRMSIVPSLLDKVHGNIRQGFNQFVLFEMGTVHNKDLIADDSLPVEEKRLGLVVAADDRVAKSDYHGAPFYQIREYVDQLFARLGVAYILQPASDHQPTMAVGKQAIAPFDRQRAVYIKTPDGTLLGEMGEIKASVRRGLKLPAFVAAAELDIERLQTVSEGTNYQPLSRYPKVEQDISLKVKSEVAYADLLSAVTTGLEANAPEGTTHVVTPIDIYQDTEQASHKHITLRLTITANDRTLKAAAVNQLLDLAADTARQKLDAERI